MFDPLFVGESVDPARPVATPARHGRTYDTYNPSLAADQMQDLATVVAWARSQPDVREVSLVGLGRSGVQVLLARPLLEGVARTAVDLDGFDPGDGSAPLPPELDLPGLLQFGGVKAAAALTAPGPLWITRTGPALDRSWPEHAYALAGVSHAPEARRRSHPGRHRGPVDRHGGMRGFCPGPTRRIIAARKRIGRTTVRLAGRRHSDVPAGSRERHYPVPRSGDLKDSRIAPSPATGHGMSASFSG